MTLDRIQKLLPQAVLEEMDQMDAEALSEGVVASEQAMAAAKGELEANPKYQQAKEDVKLLSQSFRDLKKYQNAKIQYALLRLQELGK